MNKLAHSNDETMDWIEFKAMIEAGNEDFIFEELKRLRKCVEELLPHMSKKIRERIAKGDYPTQMFKIRIEAQKLTGQS